MQVPVTRRYDTRDLVDMLTERRSRDEKDRILWAIQALRLDDAVDAAEAAHICGASEQKGDGHE
jgi:hypothetical protein